MIETIPNAAGAIVIELTIPLGTLCKYASEPQSGSALTWRYVAGDRLLPLGEARSWPETQVGEPLDLETFTRRAAEAASAALCVSVEAIGYYILKDGTTLRCTCHS